MSVQKIEPDYPLAIAFIPIQNAIEFGDAAVLAQSPICSAERLEWEFETGRLSLVGEPDGTVTLTIAGFALHPLSHVASELHNGWERIMSLLLEVMPS